MAAPGWFSDENLRKRASAVADVEDRAWRDFGEVMHALLNPEPQSGPPWTHTLIPDEPLYYDDSGTPVYPEPGPAFTVTEGHAP